MSAKQHYDTHLGEFYSWMVGDTEPGIAAFTKLLEKHKDRLGEGALALDLGAGHGIQSIAMSRLGLQVVAVDFNEQLLGELQHHDEYAKGHITAKLDDIRNPGHLVGSPPSVVVCAGDTLLHLETREDVMQLLTDSMAMLREGGLLVISFRDYTTPLEGDKRFIPVKSTHNQIHTCVLDYEDDRVRVTDLLHTNTDGQWTQKVSSYFKTRVPPADITAHITGLGGTVLESMVARGMTTLVIAKGQ
eukprot:TRINITY_DN1194_c0_g2_i8.p1 TRINITY_DN1194_c0_g2~~TRINITY_DN1194_c0_g2_i8.p1  ORF type:complete len:245 (+),score=89.96 TRINITY_DN1194_c0_g2_i8:44-778(+)